MIHDSTPRFAKQLSSKYANLSAKKVQEDLRENHCRKISKDFISSLSNDVGRLIEEQEQNWIYALPVQAIEAQVVSIGRDGTTMYLRSD
ncbi:MAG: ISKra4 family transposase, partial [Bacteroidota bacterium]